MTGDYELVQASPSHKELGIGFAADVAFDHLVEWESNKDCNLLGQALVKFRDEGRKSAHSKNFHRTFYDDQESNFWYHFCNQQRRVA